MILRSAANWALDENQRRWYLRCIWRRNTAGTLRTVHFMRLWTLNLWAAVTTVAQSTEEHVEAVWKRISRAFTVHSTNSAIQLMGSTVQLHRHACRVDECWGWELFCTLNSAVFIGVESCMKQAVTTKPESIIPWHLKTTPECRKAVCNKPWKRFKILAMARNSGNLSFELGRVYFSYLTPLGFAGTIWYKFSSVLVFVSVYVGLCLSVFSSHVCEWCFLELVALVLLTVSIKGWVGLLSGDLSLLQDLTSDDTKHVVRKTSCHRLCLLMTRFYRSLRTCLQFFFL